MARTAGIAKLRRMMTPGRRLLIRLVQNYGADGAAVRLRLSQTLLERLLSGSVEVPDRVFIRAVDVLLENAPAEPPPLTAPAIKLVTQQ